MRPVKTIVFWDTLPHSSWKTLTAVSEKIPANIMRLKCRSVSSRIYGTASKKKPILTHETVRNLKPTESFQVIIMTLKSGEML
jgi:hypothetical protein